MRTALSFFFALAGVGLMYLFAVHAQSQATQDATVLDKVLGPLQRLDPLAILCLQGALVSFLIAFFFHTSARSLPRPVGSSRVWNTLLEPAFALNAVLVGGVLLIFLSLGRGWIDGRGLGAGTLGALFLLAGTQLLVGGGLALVLGRQKVKRRALYYSVLTTLICEAGMLGTVLAVGLQA